MTDRPPVSDEQFEIIIFNLIARWTLERHEREENRGGTSTEDLRNLTRLIVAAAKRQFGKLTL